MRAAGPHYPLVEIATQVVYNLQPVLEAFPLGML